MTCIYEAWDWGRKNGHHNLRIRREPIYQESFLAEYVHVDYDAQKAESVVQAIKKKISWEAYRMVACAAMSEREDAPDIIYRFLRAGFRVGSGVTEMFTELPVMQMMEIRRTVENEFGYHREFTRFSSVDGKVYVCHMEPKNNIIAWVGTHFADRMPSENWMIIDDKRRVALVHPKDEENYLRELSEEEYKELLKTDLLEDAYSDMWKGFFQAIAIKERENPRCQRNMFPIWLRKHATEFH